MRDQECNFVSAVVYLHNEEKRIGNFLRLLISVLEDHFRYSEIICVNDFSTDNSLAQIHEVAETASNISISVINMSYCHGAELAMNAGMDLAIGDFILEFDRVLPDFAPSVIMDVYQRALEGYDIVSASPDQREQLTSRLFYQMFARFSDTPVIMHTERFRIVSRRAINRIQSMNKTIPYRKAIYTQCGLKMDNIRYHSTITSSDKGNREGKFRLNLAVNSLILFTRVGYDFSIFMTVFMMLLSVFMILYTIVTYLTSQPVAGWTTTVLFLSIAFFGLFGILTIVIKYLQLLIDLVFKKQHYSYESIEKLTV